MLELKENDFVIYKIPSKQYAAEWDFITIGICRVIKSKNGKLKKGKIVKRFKGWGSQLEMIVKRAELACNQLNSMPPEMVEKTLNSMFYCTSV